MRQPERLYNAIALALSLVLALVTYLQPGAVLAPGIDSSWAYGVTYTFVHQLVLGKDIFFTFGPLGFLEHTVPMEASLLITSAIFWYVISVLSCFLVLRLCLESGTARWYLLPNLVLGLILLVCANELVQRLLIVLYTGSLLYWRKNTWPYLLLLQIVTILCLLIKFSYGMVAIALYVPCVAVSALRQQRPLTLASGLLVPVVLYAFSWFILYGSWSGSLGYLQGGLEFSRGSTSAMALNPPNNWPAIGIFLISFTGAGIAALTSSRRLDYLLPVCFLAPFFIWAKYGFGREDSGHLAYMMSFVFYLGMVWTISATTLVRKLVTAAFITLCYFSWARLSITATSVAEFSPQPLYFPPDTFLTRLHQADVARIMQQESRETTHSLVLDPSLLETIGENSIDIYPWETMIGQANSLDWKPRPVYQSYITYTPGLDRLNQEFYDSDRAPDFILWHHHSYQDIDNRYPLSTDPLTLQSILDHYTLEKCQGLFCLWRHTTEHRLSIHALPGETRGAWGEWITVPADITDDVIRAHIAPARTIAGKLNLALWKEGGIEIDYLLKNDGIRTHTLLIDNAVSGIWVSPYVTSQQPGREASPITLAGLRDRVSYPHAEGYIEKAEQLPSSMHIAGWGLLPFRNTVTQQLSLLLYNDHHAYLFPASNKPRPGITEHFGKAGIVDLDSSGIDEVISYRGMAAGTYQVGFVVSNEGEKRSYTQTPPIIITVPENPGRQGHNVKAIRLRTTRPWAFDPAFTVSWDSLSLPDGMPW